ncbi:hypothetical protein CQW23_26432 [Capsicum baccatum]|uniref:Enoyl-CoA hydratase, mitochondrial n=1 Tax=Capsicum baccatum TaxID=33114 RepID=A0A2G2VNT9_CAPBA|nr:hypothetical protein CQW23_26432 [Capsicum baccatum]
MEKYKSLKILQKSPNSGVCFLYLNRPSHLNDVSRDFLPEFPKAISSLDQNPDVAVIIFAGSGIDFQTLDNALKGSYAADCGRNVERLQLHIKFLQEAITALECCRKQVIAAVHGACIGEASSIVGFGNAMELALTGRRFTGSEAKDLGLVSKVFTSKQALEEGVKLVAEGPNNEEQTEDVVLTKQASMTVSSHDRLQRVDNSPR